MDDMFNRIDDEDTFGRCVGKLVVNGLSEDHDTAINELLSIYDGIQMAAAKRYGKKSVVCSCCGAGYSGFSAKWDEFMNR